MATTKTAEAAASLARSLRDLLGAEGVLSGPAAERAYDCDAYTVDRSRPTAVALPKSTEEVAAVVRRCVAEGVPFTARGAGTGLSGGALPALGGVVVSTKRLTRIVRVEPENRCLLAEAGVTNRKLSQAVEAHGLHFAPDPSSGAVATLGGNIAENAGGPHTLKYGVTSGHILGVTLVAPDGAVRRFGGRTGIGPGPDPLALIVGAEGMLGIVTEAWCRLVPAAGNVRTALASFPSVRDATETVRDIVSGGVLPAALEMMDAGILKALRAAFGLEAPAGTEALLLIECDGSDSEREMAEVERICGAHSALEVRFATDEKERAKLWAARKKGVGAMGRLAPTVVTHDGVIPRSRLPEMLDEVYRIAAEEEIGVANIFHAGDGNLHPCFYFDDRDADQVARVVRAGERVIRACLDLGGSVSGEHGIGVEKLDLLPMMFAPEDLALQSRARDVFGRSELCNPCKVLPSGRSCSEHRPRWRGMAW